MELTAYLEIINRRKWILLLPILGSIMLMAIWKLILPSSSEVTATLRIVPYSSGNPAYTQLIYADRIMNTFVEIASSKPVMKEVREELNIGLDHPEDLEVRAISETELMLITVTDSDPNIARDVASAISTILLNERSIRDVRIYMVDPPEVDPGPSFFSYILDFVLAIIIGSVGGVGLGLLAENFDTKIYSTHQISESTDIPILGEIPKAETEGKSTFFEDKFPFNEYYRRLRTNLLSSAKNAPIKSILITSAEPEEGKSTIIANLASCIAETGKNVLLIDTDFYCSKIHDLFDLPNETGLSQILSGESYLSNSIQRSQRNDIKVLTSGPQNANQSELLASERMDALLQEARNYFDFVLLDTPAFSAIVDTAYLVPKVDFVLIVSKLQHSREPSLQFTIQQIKNLGANFIGLIVNNADARIPSRYIKYYKRVIDELEQEKNASTAFTEENKLKSALQDVISKSRRQIDKVLNHHIPYEIPMIIEEDLKEE